MNWLSSIRGRYRVGEDPLRTLRRIELLAVLLGLLLCLQLAWGGFRLATIAAPAAVAPAADSLKVPPVPGPAVVAADERNEIISRPLFWSSRRPVDQVATLSDPDRKPGELKAVKLVGLFGSGSQAGIIALVKGQKRRILLGDKVEGWTLESITPSELAVSNGERTEILALQRGSVKAGPSSGGKAKKSTRRSQPRPGASTPGGSARDKHKAPLAGAAGSGGATVPAPVPEAERTLGLGPGDRGNK